MKISSREVNVFRELCLHSEKFIKDLNFKDLYSDASSISIDLNIDRSHCSKIINKLHKENKLIKFTGRPTVYLVKEIVSKYLNNIYLPSVVEDKKEFIQIIKDKSSKKNIRIENLLDITGAKPNESLNKSVKILERFLEYPSHIYNIVITGRKNTGKSDLINGVHKIGVVRNKFCEEYIVINCNDFKLGVNDFSSVLDSIKIRGFENEIKLVVIKNITSIFKDVLEMFLSKLYYFQNDDSLVKMQFIFTASEEKLEDDYKRIISPYIVNEINIPDLDSRTIKEKFEHIIKIFQEEADNINIPIYVNKNIISCFATANYENNFLDLKKEIKFSISKKINIEKYARNIELEDLSDKLIYSIDNVSYFTKHLNKIFDFFDTGDFYFQPKTKSTYISKLKNSILTVNGDIVEKVQNTTIENYIYNQLNENKKLKITVFKARVIKEIYDIIYKVIINKIKINDEILYLLFSQLNKVINNIKNNKYTPDYIDTDLDLMENNFIRSVAEEVKEIIESKFEITLPNIELMYIYYFISISKNYLNNKEINFILIGENKNIINEYIKYIKNLSPNLYINFIELKKQDSKIIKREIESIINTNVSYYKTVLICDSHYAFNIINKSIKNTNYNIEIFSPLSYEIINSILSSKKNNYLLENIYLNNNIKYFNSNNSEKNINILKSTNYQKASNNLLSESLVFLDYKKASKILNKVFINICYINNIKIQEFDNMSFIHHCCFMIERVIKQESLNVKVNIKNYKLYNIVEENLQIINNTFGINIPKSEIYIIYELFLNLISKEENNGS